MLYPVGNVVDVLEEVVRKRRRNVRVRRDASLYGCDDGTIMNQRKPRNIRRKTARFSRSRGVWTSETVAADVDDDDDGAVPDLTHATFCE